jgi:hypothetical protein
MGVRTAKGPRWSKVVPSTLTRIVKSRAGASPHIVCLRHTLSSEWSPGRGKGSDAVRSYDKTSIPNIFRIRGSSRIQKVLFWGWEDLLCGNYVLKEALVLFQGWPHQSLNKPVVTWHLSQQRQLWMNRQLGDRTFRVCSRFWETYHNKIANPGRFRGRMDGATILGVHHARIPLVSILWWSLGQHQSCSSYNSNLTFQNEVVLHSHTSVHQQCKQMHKKYRWE